MLSIDGVSLDGTDPITADCLLDGVVGTDKTPVIARSGEIRPLLRYCIQGVVIRSMAGDASTNAQSQSQQQVITISVESAGDPDLERRIFSQVHSAGRQLRNLAAVIEVLLTAQQAANPAFAQTGPDHEAVEAFREMQTDILRAKSTVDADHLISQLDALRRVDANAFAALRDRLNAWLPGK